MRDRRRRAQGLSNAAAGAHRLGVVRERRQDWAGAAAAFEEAAALEPGWAARHYRLGNARERWWDPAGACEAYATAVAMAPHRESWSRRLAQVRSAAAGFRRFGGQVIAHRGRNDGRTENALDGLAHLPAMVAGVEVDVRLSRDGVAMLMHDARVDRTTGGQGLLEELPYPELRELGVATLTEYLEVCEPLGFRTILLDVKSPTRETLRTVAADVRGSAVAERCVVLVRGERPLYEFREVAHDLRLGGLGTRLVDVERRIAVATKCQAELLLVAHGDQRYLDNRRAVGTIQSAGLSAGASVVNSWEALDAVRVDRCDVLLTDRADQLSYFVSGVSRPRARTRIGPPSA